MNIRPLMAAQELYRSFYEGSEWTNVERALPSPGHMCYVIIHDQDHLDHVNFREETPFRGFITENGWRLYNGRLVEVPYQVVFWKYDETSQGRCTIV